MISIANLTFSYPETSVFDDFNLEITEAITGLVGENGAGKSTLIKILSGILKASSDNMTIGDISVVHQKLEVLNKIGVLFENPVFPDWSRVSEYLQWVGEIRGLSKTEAIQSVKYLLWELGLEDKKKSLVKTLSAGLKQRFGIAQAIIGLPQYIFLDEPTANLDVKFRRKILNLMRMISTKFGTKVIILSHILSDLEKFCDEIIMIHKGKLIFQEKTSNIRNHLKIKRLVVQSGEQILGKLKKFLQDYPDIKILYDTRYEIEISLTLNSEASLSNFPEYEALIIKNSMSDLENIFLNLIQGE